MVFSPKTHWEESLLLESLSGALTHWKEPQKWRISYKTLTFVAVYLLEYSDI